MKKATAASSKKRNQSMQSTRTYCQAVQPAAAHAAELGKLLLARGEEKGEEGRAVAVAVIVTLTPTLTLTLTSRRRLLRLRLVGQRPCGGAEALQTLQVFVVVSDTPSASRLPSPSLPPACLPRRRDGGRKGAPSWGGFLCFASASFFFGLLFFFHSACHHQQQQQQQQLGSGSGSMSKCRAESR